MSGGFCRETDAADQIRRRLAWLSAQKAGVRLMGYTRPFTTAERKQLATIEAESASLLRRLEGLHSHAVPLAPRPAPPAAGPHPSVAA